MSCLDSAVDYMGDFPLALKEKRGMLEAIAAALGGTWNEFWMPWAAWSEVRAGAKRPRHAVVHRGVPQQTNNTDCGVFVLEYLRLIVDGSMPAPNTKGGDLRRRMTIELASEWWRTAAAEEPRTAAAEWSWACSMCTFVHRDAAAAAYLQCSVCNAMRR